MCRSIDYASARARGLRFSIKKGNCRAPPLRGAIADFARVVCMYYGGLLASKLHARVSSRAVLNLRTLYLYIYAILWWRFF